MRTLSAIGKYDHVKCHGLLGTFDDGLAWLKEPRNCEKPHTILFMGSSIGNFNRTQAVEFLKGFSAIMRPEDTMLVGVDACQDEDKVFHAYNDKQSKTHEFILNGLEHANRLMGKKVFCENNWRVIGEYDSEAERHQAFVSPNKDVMFEKVLIKANERIRIEESYKHSLSQSTDLWYNAGLVPQARFGNRTDQYRKFVAVALSSTNELGRLFRAVRRNSEISRSCGVWQYPPLSTHFLNGSVISYHLI